MCHRARMKEITADNQAYSIMHRPSTDYYLNGIDGWQRAGS